MKTIRAAKTGYMLTAAVTLAAGLILLIWPKFSMKLICYLAGAILIVGGIFRIVGYFSKDLYRLAFQFDLAFGILTVVVGLIMVLHPDGVVSFIHFIVGILVLMDGLLKVQTTLDAKRFGLTEWWLIGVAALLTVLFGLLLVVNPFGSAVVLLRFMGITLLCEGILNLCVAGYAVKVIKKAKPDVIDID